MGPFDRRSSGRDIALFVVGTTSTAEGGVYFDALADALSTGDGGFWVLDRGRRVLDRVSATGQAEATVGAEGDGPGEFRDPVAVMGGSADSVLVFDRGLQRLSVFASDGAFARSVTLRNAHRPAAVVRMADGRWIARETDRLPRPPAGVGLARDTVAVAFIDGGQWDAPLMRVPGQLSSTVAIGGRTGFRSAPFTPGVVLTTHGACAVIAVTDRPTLLTIDASGSVAEVSADVAGRPVTAEDWAAVRDLFTQSVPDEARAQVLSILDRTPRPDSIPAFADMLVDAGGLVWLQRWGPPLGPSPEWSIHDGAGRTVARVDFGRPVRLFGVTDSIAFGALEDEYGADVFAAWRVERDGAQPEGITCRE